MTSSSPRASQTDASAFLASLRGDLRSAFLTVRALALSLGPEVGEQVTGGEVVYTRRDKEFMRVRSARSQIHLVFPEGVSLPDPSGRLLRRGEEWYVPLDQAESLDGHVQEFVGRAYAAFR